MAGNDDDGETEEASAEEHRSLRRIVGKSQFSAPRRPDIAFVTNRLARSLANPSKSDIIASKRVSSWVIMLDGFLLSASARTQSVIAQSSCEAEYIAATAATSEVKYIKALFLACGQHVNIHLRSDSSGAIGVASRRSLQRLRHLDVRFLWLQAETANKNIRISKVHGPENWRR